MTKKKRNYIAENAARMRAASPKVVISPEIPGQRKTKVGQVPQ